MAKTFSDYRKKFSVWTLSRKEQVPISRKILSLIIWLSIYSVFHWLLYPVLGFYTISFSIPIVIVAAWYFSWIGVVAISIFLIIYNALLWALLSRLPYEGFMGPYYWAAYATYFVFGIFIAYLQTLIHDYLQLAGEEADIERRYQALFERSQDMVFIVGLDQCMLAVNRMVLEKFGYLEEELVGEHISKIISPDELGRAESRVALLIKDTVLPNYERIFIKKDGTQLIGEITPSVVFDENGEPAYLQSIIRDITERKAMEERLQYSEHLYKNFMKHSQDSIVLIDPNGITFEINDYGAEILGSTVKEMIGKSMVDFSAPEEQEQSMHALQRILSGEVLPTYERTNIAGDGTEIRLSVSIVLVRDENGEPLYVQSIARDITEQKKIEERLRYSENLYKNLMKHSGDSIVLFDLEGKIFEINQFGAELLGGTIEEILGRTMEDFAAPEELEQSKLAFQQILSGDEIPTYERKNITLDGRELMLSVNVSLVTNEAGEPLYVQSSARDITEQKYLNEQLQYMATHDQLTGLLNRRVLGTEIQKLILQDSETKPELALFFIDLDKFKPVNDEFGHAMGDQMLVALAERLCALLDEEDLLARVGGDEFVLIKVGFESKGELNQLAEMIVSEIELPVEHKNIRAAVSASVGIAIYSDNIETADELLIRADQAMYFAKENLESNIFFWDDFVIE